MVMDRLSMAVWMALAAPCAVARAEPADEPTTRVEIVGDRFREAAGKTSVGGAELARVPGAGGDPMRAIQTLPGVAIVDDGISEPAVRGSRPSDNAYVVDFLPVGYLFHLGGFTSVLNADLIERFSMSSAAWTPEHASVVGAVFDVQLRRPRTDRLGGSLDLGLLGANALVEGPLGDDVSFFFAARRSWFDLVVSRIEDKEEGVTFTTPVYSDAQGRLLWKLGGTQRLRLDFSAATDKLLFTVKEDGNAAERDPLLAGQGQNRQSYQTLAGVWEWDIRETLGSRVALGRMHRRTSLRLGAAGVVDVVTHTTYLRQQLSVTAWRDHDITLGGSVEGRVVDVGVDFNLPRCTEFDPNCDVSSSPRLVTDQRARRNAADLHANDRWQLGRRWVATAGLRIARESNLEKTAVEPRLGVEFSPEPDLTFSAGLGRHSQPPDSAQSVAEVGNPALGPVRSNHAVAGVSQRLADGWSWRAEAYAKTFSGYAVADPDLLYVNGASGRAHGLELLLKKDPAGGPFSGYASVSLSRSRRTVDATGTSFPFTYDQPVIVNLVGQYQHNERWSYGWRWSYHSGALNTPVVGTASYPDGRTRPVYGAVNSERLPAYHRLDLRADARMSPAWSFYVELLNAYDHANVGGYSYSADYQTRQEVQELGLLISGGLKFNF